MSREWGLRQVCVGDNMRSFYKLFVQMAGAVIIGIGIWSLVDDRPGMVPDMVKGEMTLALQYSINAEGKEELRLDGKVLSVSRVSNALASNTLAPDALVPNAYVRDSFQNVLLNAGINPADIESFPEVQRVLSKFNKVPGPKQRLDLTRSQSGPTTNLSFQLGTKNCDDNASQERESGIEGKSTADPCEETVAEELPYYDGNPVLSINAGQHSSDITSMDSDAKGRYLVTGSSDKTVRVWDLSRGRLDKTIHIPFGGGPVGSVGAVAISPDAEYIAVGGYLANVVRERIYIFRRSTGKIVRIFERDVEEIVTALAFSGTGSYLAAGVGTDGLRIWETKGDPVRWYLSKKDPEGYGGYISDIKFSGDEKLYFASINARGGTIQYYQNSKTSSRSSVWSFQKGTQLNSRSPFGISLRLDKSDKSLDLAVAVVEDSMSFSRIEVYTDNSWGSPTALATTSSVQGIFPLFADVLWSQDGQSLLGAGAILDIATGLPRLKAGLVKWGDGSLDSPQYIDTGFPNMVANLSSTGKSTFAAAHDGSHVSVLDTKERQRLKFPRKTTIITTATEIEQKDLMISPDGWTVALKRLDSGRAIWMRSTLPESKISSQEAVGRGPLLDGGLQMPGVVEKFLTGLHRASRAQERSQVSRFDIPDIVLENIEDHTLDVTGERIVLGGSFGLSVYSETGLVWTDESLQPLLVNISQDGKIVVAASEDGTITWHRADTGEHLVSQLISWEERTKWITWLPDGRYDVSIDGGKLLGWRFNNGSIKAASWVPMSMYRTTYFCPEAIEKLVAMASPDPTAASLAAGCNPIDLEGVRNRVKSEAYITNTETRNHNGKTYTDLSFIVYEPGDQPIEELSISIDGRRSIDLAPKYFETDVVHTVTFEVQEDEEFVGLFPRTRDGRGKYSQASLYQNGILGSQPTGSNSPVAGGDLDPKSKKKKKKKKKQKALRKGKLNYLVVGVSEFDWIGKEMTAKNRDFAEMKVEGDDQRIENLKYAEDDAITISKILDAQMHREVRGAGIYNRNATGMREKLIGKDATTGAILETLQKMGEASGPQDVTVLFFSSHGEVVTYNVQGERKTQYIFYTYNIDLKDETTRRSADSSIGGLTGEDLVRWLKKFHGEVYVFVDTCQSGGATSEDWATHFEMQVVQVQFQSAIYFIIASDAQYSYENTNHKSGNFAIGVSKALTVQPNENTKKLDRHQIRKRVIKETEKAAEEMDAVQTPFTLNYISKESGEVLVTVPECVASGNCSM